MFVIFLHFSPLVNNILFYLWLNHLISVAASRPTSHELTITAAKEVIFSSTLVRLLAGLRKKYSIDFHKIRMERWRRKELDFGGISRYFSVIIGLWLGLAPTVGCTGHRPPYSAVRSPHGTFMIPAVCLIVNAMHHFLFCNVDCTVF